jgi:hypothetical protein
MKTVEEKLERLNQILDEYETLNGLPRFHANDLGDEINSYLSMTTEHMEKLHISDCGNIAARLSQQSFHLQRAYNRERAQVTSMQVALDKCVAKQVGNYSTFVKHDMVVAMVVNDDEYAKTLQNIIVRATQRMNRLYGLSEHLSDISNKFLAIQRAKISVTKSTGG